MSIVRSLRRNATLLAEFIQPDRAQQRAIPTLDAGLLPNDDLDGFEPLWRDDHRDGPDSLAWTTSGLLVASGSDLVLLRPEGFEVAVRRSFDKPVGAIAVDGDDVWVVLIGGHIHRVRVDADSLVVEQTLAVEVACPTDAAYLDKSLFITEGSTNHAPGEWTRDLMTLGRSGRVLRVDVGSGSVEVLAQGLAWAGGITAAPDGSGMLVSEMWRHQILAVGTDGRQRPFTRPLAGYPGRLDSNGDGGVLVALPALRTHLVEFVLREAEYRDEMVRTIAPEFWLAPSLRTDGGPWEPMQVGGAKHLGMTKPWAPPRAYGLVGLVGATGHFTHSWHARVGSPRSGISAAITDGRRVFAASRGGRVVLAGGRKAS